MSTFSNFFAGLLGRDSNTSNKNRDKKRHGRVCRIEELESRELLSVSLAEFHVIRETYADLNLSSNMDDYNIIEVGVANPDGVSSFSFGNFRSAVNRAAATAADDLIVVRPGATNYLRLNSEITININEATRGSVTIVSLGARDLIIDGDDTYRTMNITNSTVAFGGVTFRNGFSGSTGGAIYATGSTLAFSNCTFLNNLAYSTSRYTTGGAISATNCFIDIWNSTFRDNATWSWVDRAFGGAIYTTGNSSSMRVYDTLFTDNEAYSRDATAYGGAFEGGNATFTRCTLMNNTVESVSTFDSIPSSDPYGGVAAGGACDGGAMTFIDCLLSYNSAIARGHNEAYGGAIRSNSSVYLFGCVINNNDVSSKGNYANAAMGGGIYVTGTGTLVMDFCEIADNSSGLGNSNASAGGIFLGMNSRGTITNSKIVGNVAGNNGTNCEGGGIRNRGTLWIENSIIAGNRSAYGGGIWSDGSLSVTNVTIVGNMALVLGGGIRNYGNGFAEITNSIIAYNGTPKGIENVATSSDGFNSTALTNIWYSLIDNTATPNGGKALGDLFVVGSLLNVDPNFVSFTPYTTWNKNLWKNWDLRLAKGSPAINTGDKAGITKDDTDLLGQKRLVGKSVDMGAYEYNATIANAEKPKVKVDKKATTISSITLTWTAPKGATLGSWYSISYTDPSTGTIIRTDAITGNSYVLRNLKPNTTYKFTISLYNADNSTGVDAKGNPITATINAKTAKYAPVLQLKVGKLNFGTIPLSWTIPKKSAPGAAYTEYEVVWLTDRNDKVGTPCAYLTNLVITMVGTKTVAYADLDILEIPPAMEHLLLNGKSVTVAIRATTTVDGVLVGSTLIKKTVSAKSLGFI